MSIQIFVNDEWENKSKNGDVVCCGLYHKYWMADKTKNEAFDMFSGKILDVKDNKESGIRFFFNQLDEELCKGVSICVVPSHKQSDTNDYGVAEFASRLAKNGRNDMVDLLLRIKTIDKLAYGGNRNIQVHRESISINNNMSVKGEVVLIVDDVTTSGASLEACKQILLENGADSVAMLALGQSV